MSMTNNTDSRYIVKVSNVQHGSRFGRYVNVAVLEVDPGVNEVTMISTRAKGVRSIVWESGAVSCGKTSRSSSRQAIDYAEALSAELNERQANAAAALAEAVSLAT
jgi:hypothetical protein